MGRSRPSPPQPPFRTDGRRGSQNIGRSHWTRNQEDYTNLWLRIKRITRIFDYQSRGLHESLTTNQEDYTNLWLRIFDYESRRFAWGESLTTNQDASREENLWLRIKRIILIQRSRTRIFDYEYERLYLSSEVGHESLTTFIRITRIRNHESSWLYLSSEVGHE